MSPFLHQLKELFSGRSLLFLLIFFATLVFTRTYNISQTARFTEDEASDLARMQNYYQDRKITLVGPISNDNSKVFSSVTYYMLMPFAAAADFEPIGPVYGTVFWGILTAILLLALAHKLNARMLIAVAALVLVWHPLVETSRWAWNPHYVFFWAALAFVCYAYKERLRYESLALAATGFFLAMTFHHHYATFFAASTAIALIGWDALRQRKYRLVLSVLLGYSLPFLIFLLFDLRHPPGLFLTRYLLSGDTPHIESGFSLSYVLPHLLRNIQVFLQTLAPQPVFQGILGILAILLAVFDIRRKNWNVVRWLLPVLATLVGFVIFEEAHVRYFYLAAFFFLLWILLPRQERRADLVNKSIFGVLIVSSLLSLGPLLTTSQQPDMRSFTIASNVIAKTIQERQVKNPNVAALASRDYAPLAEPYRHVLGMKGVSLKASSEYDTSENLFVISTADEQTLRQDKSYAMLKFQNARLEQKFDIPESEWKIYWFAH